MDSQGQNPLNEEYWAGGDPYDSTINFQELLCLKMRTGGSVPFSVAQPGAELGIPWEF